MFNDLTISSLIAIKLFKFTHFLSFFFIKKTTDLNNVLRENHQFPNINLFYLQRMNFCLPVTKIKIKVLNPIFIEITFTLILIFRVKYYIMNIYVKVSTNIYQILQHLHIYQLHIDIWKFYFFGSYKF